MSRIDQVLDNARDYARSYDKGGLPMTPATGIAVIACMDARVDVYGILGLKEGDAHVIRNAGGAVTEDVIRSLAISQRLLGTREVMLIHHADCGMRTFDDAGFKNQIEAETGIRPAWAAEVFADSASDVRQSMRRVETNPFLPSVEQVRGFVYDESTGELGEIT